MLSIFKSLYFLKWCPIFDTSPLHQFSKFNNFLWVCWFLGKNLSSFVYPAWKLDNPYYHTYRQFIHLLVEIQGLFVEDYLSRKLYRQSILSCLIFFKRTLISFFCLHLYCMTTLVVTGNWTLFWLCTVGYFDQKICHIKVTHFDFFGFLDLLSENLQAEWDRIKFLWFALRKFWETVTALTDTFRFFFNM